MRKIIKRILISISSILLIFVLIVGGYLSYILIQYNRIDDNIVLEVNQNVGISLEEDKTYRIITYNIGFGAYTPDFSFFMDEGYMEDGTKVVGKSSRAKSKESVINCTNGVINDVKNLNPDFVFYQEVDTNSDRSFHVNQVEMICNSFSEYANVFANNYHSAYLFYPFTNPIGKSNSGILTLSKYHIESSLRRSYPLSNGFDKFFDLDRCFSVSRIPFNNKELLLVNSHMSAYDKGGVIRAKQIKMMKDFCEEEIKKGNYIIYGGDFNHDLLMDNPSFNYEETKPDWMNFTQLKPDWLASFDYENDLANNMHVAVSDNAPTCRDADLPLIGHENELYKSVIDGFILTDNIEIINVTNIDNGFSYSDHQMVVLDFKLK